MSDNGDGQYVDLLTEREQDVLNLLAQGKSNRELAEALVLSLNTVKWYARQIYGKLGVANRDEAVARARALGLLAEEAQPLPRHNLPLQLNSFVGREPELAEVKRLLSASRLVTLTGAGGCGKTRLALQAAVGVLTAFPDGVWLVELAPLSDPELVPQAVAETLGLREAEGRSWLALLQSFIRDRKLLLVLDNCEHLVDAAARLAESLMRRCPELNVLTTSREALNISGETVWPVPPLSLPDEDEPASLTGLARSDAVCLFVERAAAVLPGFLLARENAAAVAHVCRQLDGLPLAIELAAAWVRLLRVEQIASHLDDRFHRLAGGSRTAMARHQTLTALIDWSYDLLTAAEQRLLRLLSVFAGGFTYDAVKAVWGHDDGDAIDLLLRLVGKSLVVADRERGQVGRLHLLETIRQYALEKLKEDVAASVAARDHHLHYFLSLAEEIESQLVTAAQTIWLSRLEADHENFRVALDWARSKGDAEALARLSGALGVFWGIRGYLAEGEKWLALALTQRDQLSTAAAASVLFASGWLTFERGDYAAAKMCYQESHRLMAQSGQSGRVAELLTSLSHVAQQQGEFAQATKLCAESLALYRAMNDLGGVASCLFRLGRMAELQGDPLQAEQLIAESLALRENIGDERGIASSLNSLAELARYHGDYGRAQLLKERSLAICLRLADMRCIAGVNHNLGHVALIHADFVQALSHFRESLLLYHELDNVEGIALCLLGFGGVYGQGGDLTRAVQLLSVATRLLRLHNIVMTTADQATYQRAVAEVTARTDEESFTRYWTNGQTMTVDEALAQALAGAGPDPTL